MNFGLRNPDIGGCLARCRQKNPAFDTFPLLLDCHLRFIVPFCCQTKKSGKRRKFERTFLEKNGFCSVALAQSFRILPIFQASGELLCRTHRAGRRPPARPPDAPCQPPREAASDGASHAAEPPPPPAGRSPWHIPTPRHLVRNPWSENPGPKSWCEKSGPKVFPDFWDNGSNVHDLLTKRCGICSKRPRWLPVPGMPSRCKATTKSNFGTPHNPSPKLS